MTDHTALDERLRHLAHATLNGHAAAVDLDAELAALLARLGDTDADTVSVVANRHRRRSWLAGAAAIVAVAATLVTVVLVRRSTEHRDR